MEDGREIEKERPTSTTSSGDVFINLFYLGVLYLTLFVQSVQSVAFRPRCGEVPGRDSNPGLGRGQDTDHKTIPPLEMWLPLAIAGRAYFPLQRVIHS